MAASILMESSHSLSGVGAASGFWIAVIVVLVLDLVQHR